MKWTFLLAILFSTSAAFATDNITLSGKLLDPNGDPVVGNSISFSVAILDPAATACVLHTETMILDMSNSQGFFELKLGGGTSLGPYSLRQAFNNATTFSALICDSGTTYAPGATDGRKVKITFNDGSPHTLAAIDISSVPYSFSADTVSGFGINGLMRVADSGTPGSVAALTTTSFNELTSLIAGTSTQYTKSGQLNGAAVPAMTNGQVLGWNGSTWNAITPLTSESDPTVKAFAKSNLPTCSVGEVLKADGTSFSCVTDAAGSPVLVEADIPTLTTAGKVSGSAINTGTIGGNANVNTTGSIFGNIVSTQNLRVYDSTNTNRVNIASPAGVANYSLTLPMGLPGVNGQALTSDTSGNLSWSTPGGGGTVASVTSGGLPIVVGGTVAAPTVSVNAATTSATGVVQLAADGGATAGTVVQGNDSRFSQINGKAVTYTSLTTGDVLKYNGTGWVNTALSSASLLDAGDLLKASNMPANCSAGSSLTFSSPTGTWSCTTIPDATASSKGIVQVGTGLNVSSGIVSLTPGIVTAGTYSKVTVDTYGRVTAGANIAGSDVTAALGYTPVNKAGDTMTGALGLASYTNATETTLMGSLAAGDKGKTWFNSDIKQMRMWDGSQIVDITTASAPTASEDGKSLRWDQTTKSWVYFTAGAAGAGIATLNGLSVSSQNFAVGTSGIAPGFTSSGSTHTLNIPMASTSSVTAGLINKTDYDNFNSKLGASSAFSGDVSGTSSTTSVDKIKGKTVAYTSITSGQYLKYDGTNLVNSNIAISDVTNLSTQLSNKLDASNMPANCSVGSTLTFSSPTGTWACSAIAVNASNFGSQTANTFLAAPNGSTGTPSFRTIAAADLPASASYWQAATGGINYAGGNVGVGTTNPTYPLHVVAGMAVGQFESTVSGNTGRLILAGNIGTAATPIGSLLFKNTSNSYTLSSIYGVTDGNVYSGALIFNTGSSGATTEQMRITASGNVGIGTTTPAYKLDVQGVINTSGSYNQTSDIRLKTNIEYMRSEEALAKIASLRGILYDWKDPVRFGADHQVGLIAQDVQKVFPEAVKSNSEGFLSVSYSSLVAPVVEAVKELLRRSDEQAREIASLKEDNDRLKRENDLKSQDLELIKRENSEIKSWICTQEPRPSFCQPTNL